MSRSFEDAPFILWDFVHILLFVYIWIEAIMKI